MSTFDPVRGPARQPVDLVSEAVDPRTIGEDFRRRRARFFDGRFLTARDLTREQQYALIRQADLGQSGGGGVVAGLRVARVKNAQTIGISSGNGITPAGEIVRLKKPVTIDVRNIPAIERLDATFGLAKLPGEPTGKRSGLFVLALRPVEFTDNPTVSYPVGLDDRRRLEAGEIVEATALIMVPFKKTGQDVVEKESRADLAREIFFERGLRRLSGEALPLAVVALDRGNIGFVDEFLVRRNVGSAEVVSFGLGERSLREAFLLQYAAHLADVEKGRAQQGLRDAYAASEFFGVLPPFGPLPAGSVEIQGDSIRHSFFPPDMNVEITVIAQDELASLAEESLTFGPIDLKESEETLELTAVMICIPMDAELYAQKIAQFRSRNGNQLEQRINRPTARVLPIAALDALRRRGLRLPAVTPNPVDVAPWHDALKSSRQLYYVRRRQVPQVSFIVPRFPEIGEDDPTDPNRNPPLWTAPVRQRLVDAGELVDPVASPQDAGLLRRFDLLVRRASADVVQALHDFFKLPVFDTQAATRVEAKLLVNSAIAELAYRARTRLEDLVRAETFPETTLPGSPSPIVARLAEIRVRALRLEDVAALIPLYDPNHPSNDPAFGEGLRALLANEPNFNEPLNRSVLALSLRVRDLDKLIRDTSPALGELSPRLLAFVGDADLDGIWRVAAGIPDSEPTTGGT